MAIVPPRRQRHFQMHRAHVFTTAAPSTTNALLESISPAVIAHDSVPFRLRSTSSARDYGSAASRTPSSQRNFELQARGSGDQVSIDPFFAGLLLMSGPVTHLSPPPLKKMLLPASRVGYWSLQDVCRCGSGRDCCGTVVVVWGRCGMDAEGS